MTSDASHGFTALPGDVLKRRSFLPGIFKALNTLFPHSNQADGWIRRPNPAPLFLGRSAFERVLAVNLADLLAVRDYSDIQVDGASSGHGAAFLYEPGNGLVNAGLPKQAGTTSEQ